MKFYIKDQEGKLREATSEEILSPDSVLCNEKGDVLGQSVAQSDPVAELTGVVKELAEKVGSIGEIKEKTEVMEAQLKIYQEASERGFPIPSIKEEPGESKTIYSPYNMAKQGKRLMDKAHHPLYQISEEKRQFMAEYFVLFLKAAYFQNPTAKIKLAEKYGRGIDSRTKADLGDTGNVFPVPDIVDEEILAFAREKSVILSEARIWEMTSDKQSFPAESSGPTAYWGNTTQKSDPVITEVELSATELSAYTAARNATLDDARSDIVSWLTELMAEAAGQEIDNESFNGDGTNVCSGILSAACGKSVTMSSGNTAFSNLDATDFSNMIAQLDGLIKLGAKFFMHGSVLHYVRTLEDSQGRPIFMERYGAPVDATILGYPYKEVITLPSTSAANTAFIAFGNLRYFGVGRRLDTTTLQVDPYGLWTTNRTRFKIYQRWGLKIALANGLVRLLTAAS